MVFFTVHFRSLTQKMGRIESHAIDLCIISKRKGTHHWIPLFEDNMVAMVSVSHPLAKAEAVPINIFEQEPYIDTYGGMDIDNAHVFKNCGIHPNTQFSTMDIYATYSMVEAGLGITMDNAINSKLCTANICTLPLVPLQKVKIGLAASRHQTPATETFLKFIEKDIKHLFS